MSKKKSDQDKIKEILKIDTPDPLTGHIWQQRNKDNYITCKLCLNIRPANGTTSKCRGKIKLSLR